MSTRLASRQRRPQRRFARAAEILPRATEFSDDPQLCDPVWVVTQIQNHPRILDDLVEATSFESSRGRNRVPGRWCLIMLAMTLSGEVDVQTFRNRYAQSPVWSAAGFSYVPTAQTCWNRLTEMEPAHHAFEEAANKLIARAVEAEPRIARDVWNDATGFETNAVLEHCCEDRDACRARSKASGRGKPPPRYLDRAGNELIKDTRHDEAKESPDTDGDSKPLPAVNQEDSPGERPKRRKRPYRYFEYGPARDRHLYRTMDPEAGARIYEGSHRGRRFWLGGLNQAAVSFYLGAPLAVNVIAANESEATQYPTLYRKLLKATGGVKPDTMIGDRGLSISTCSSSTQSRASPPYSRGASRARTSPATQWTPTSTTATECRAASTAAAPATSRARAWATS